MLAALRFVEFPWARDVTAIGVCPNKALSGVLDENDHVLCHSADLAYEGLEHGGVCIVLQNGYGKSKIHGSISKGKMFAIGLVEFHDRLIPLQRFCREI